MAVTITLNNSRLMGSPIVAEVNVNERAEVVFHRVVLSVAMTGGGSSGTFKFSSPVAGSPLQFDISSAFRAVADKFSPTATALSYPSYSLSITAREEYMVDGIVRSGDEATLSQTGDVYMGSYTDLERISGQAPARWSRKPTSSPQIAFTGKSLIVPGTCSGGGVWAAPSVSTPTVAAGANTTYNYYGITTPPHGHEIRFINSLGVHENIFVAGLPTRAANITTDQYTIARQETLTQFSRAIAVKYGDRETWTFSSGPLDEAWVSWYIHEFLMARWVWIDINNIWIPCHVLPEEQVTLVQHDKTDMLEVMLALKLDINGSPM